MSVIKGQLSLLTGVTVENALAGDTFEFLRGQRPSKIVGGCVSDVVGGFYTFQIGDSVTTSRVPADVETGAGRGVNLREDLDVLEVGMPPDRLKLRLENPTAGTLVFHWYFLIV